jgi:sigma-B regulation protein RsbU (phosphoserine phosphatase)
MRAARSVGGDFYDIFHLPDGRLAFVVADTCGKGVQAAIFMTMARSVFQNVVQWTPAPRSCLYGANRMLAQQNPATMFVAACYAVFDPATGRLTYGSGGGDMPMLRRADGRVERLPRVTGLIVGIMEDFAFAEGEAQLEPGDELVLYTDGITEAVAPSGEMFGEDRLAEALSARRPGPAEEIVAQLIGAVEAYSAGREQSDDITCLVLRYLGAG